MFVPDHFRLDDADQIFGLMQARPFAILVGWDAESGLVATHLPTVVRRDPAAHGTIEAHFARANPHWRMYERDDALAMFIYNGAENYIRPGWYPSKADTGKVVPTWNYDAIHAYGRIELVRDVGWLRDHVATLSNQQEAGQEQPWSLSDAPDDYTNIMLRGIIGLRFKISRLEGKRKMSQNRASDDREGVVAGLRARGDDAAVEVAAIVSQELAKTPESG
ncbi:MAG: FMN-binding negative transcriptional regulator [Hyphomicrobiaceae bacterium]